MSTTHNGNDMRMLRYFKVLSFRGCTNVFSCTTCPNPIGNVSTYHKSPQLSHIVGYVQLINYLYYFYLVINSAFTGNHKGPTAISKTIILKNAFETFPDAIEPELSNTNHAKIPINTDLRTNSGALS